MTGIWQTAFVEPIREFFREVGTLLPHLLAMLVIVVIGFVVAWGVAAAISRLLRVAGFDQFSGRVGFTQALSNGGVRETPSHLISHLLYWVIVLAFMMLGLGALQLPPVDHFVEQVLSYLPHVLVAIMILVGGLILANFLASAALIAAVNAQVTQARLLARGVWLAMLLLTLAMTFGAMSMLGLDLQSVSIASLILALGLLVDDPVVAGDAIKRDLAAGQKRIYAAWIGPTRLGTAILFFAGSANVWNVALLQMVFGVALAFYDRALRGDSSDAGIHLNRATALMLMGDEARAQEAAATGVKLAGGVDQAGALLGLKSDNPKEAGKAAEKSIVSKGEIQALLHSAAAAVPSMIFLATAVLMMVWIEKLRPVWVRLRA